MLDRFKKDKYLWGVVVIILLAIFVRGWMFSDLLTFKMDQARDIKLVEEAYEAGNGKLSLKGLGDLPLLGPRAAKTYLRLGPISYYFEYASLLIFGDKPWAAAVPDFILSILTIPLFYYFVRQVFSKKVSLMTTAVFASSFFLTQYGRFAWNPNAIPFWSLVYFLGLYKLVESQKSKVESHKAGKWLLVAVVGYGVASQLHFTAMLAYPLIGILFLVVTWKIRWWLKISWGYWFGAIVILGVMYLPMIFSEICTQGDNWLQFKYALGGRGKEEFTLYAKVIQSLKLHSEYFWFSLTSMSGGAGTLGVIGFGGIVGSLFVVFIRGMFFKKAQDIRLKTQTNYKLQGTKCKQVTKFKIQFKVIRQGKNSNYSFFLLIWIWLGVMFLLYTKLAFNVIKPRYWLLEAPIFFIWIALIFEWLARHKNIIKKSIYFLVSVLVVMNLWAVGNWYYNLQTQQKEGRLIWDLKLKDENMIPWGQLQKSADYIEKMSEQTNKDVCFYTTGEYRPVYNYIFKKRGLEKQIRRISFSKDDNESCLFVAIDHRQRREIPRIPKDYQDEFEKVINSNKEIGFITIWKIKHKDQEIKDDEQSIVDKNQEMNKEEQNVDVEEIHYSEVDEKNNNSSEIDRKKIEKPKRIERVRWKDVFECE